MSLLLLGGKDDSVVFLLEPFDRLLFRESVRDSNLSGLLPSVRHVVAGTAENHEEIKTVDTDGRIVLDSEIDVFLDTEPEVACETCLGYQCVL